jgi:hypothetical protein
MARELTIRNGRVVDYRFIGRVVDTPIAPATPADDDSEEG